MTVVTSVGGGSESESMVFLNLIICPWTVEFSGASLAAANKHFNANRYFSVHQESTRLFLSEGKGGSNARTPPNVDFKALDLCLKPLRGKLQ